MTVYQRDGLLAQLRAQWNGASADKAAQREALALLELLGARPLADGVRRRRRAAGVRGLSRAAAVDPTAPGRTH